MNLPKLNFSGEFQHFQVQHCLGRMLNVQKIKYKNLIVVKIYESLGKMHPYSFLFEKVKTDMKHGSFITLLPQIS